MEFRSDLLAGIYQLPHRPAAYLQDESSCLSYLKLFLKAFDPLWNLTDPPPWCSAQDLSCIKSCKAALEGTDKSIKWCAWYPAYGCLVVAHAFENQMIGTVVVTVLGLDPHEFSIHCQPGKESYDYLGRASNFKQLFVGTIYDSSLEDLKAQFLSLLREAQARKGAKRSAGGGNQGHQFTPSMIHVLLKQAVASQCAGGRAAELSPKGGFTDCGVHTGGDPRNTSFPLARSFLHWLVMRQDDSYSTTFRKLMLFFDLRVIEEGLAVVQKRLPGMPDSACTAAEIRMDLDGAMEIFVDASFKFEDLAKSIVDVTSLFDMARLLKSQIEDFVRGLQADETKSCVMDNLESELCPGAFRDPLLDLEEGSPWDTSGFSEADVTACTQKNIGLVPVFGRSSLTLWPSILSWIKSPSLQACTVLEHAWLVIRTTENFFWVQVEKGLETTFHVDTVFEVITEYRRVVNALLTTLDPSHSRKTELYSRELLVTWVGYCLVFYSVQELFADSPLSDMGVCLRYQDLEHLVLSDKRLWTVVHRVKIFLHQHFVPSKELFSLRSPQATFDFGELFSKQRLHHIYECEYSNADWRTSNYWRKVLQLKRTLQRLRSELSELQAEKVEIQAARDLAKQAYDNSCQFIPHKRRHGGYYVHGDAEREELEMQRAYLSSKVDEIKRKEDEIETAKVAPEPLLQPLPSIESLAHQWLFFLHMPPNLRTLATLSFTAQQTLVPRLDTPADRGGGQSAFEELRSAYPDGSITDYYNQRKDPLLNIHPGADSHVMLKSTVALIPPKPITVLDQIQTPSDGVWYPDSWHPRMAWFGGPLPFDCPGFEFDPFRIKRETVVSFFTEQLNQGPSGEPNTLQWIMTQDGSRPEARGNLPLAKQDVKPEWLTKPQYLMLCKARAFPLSQLRTLLVMLSEDSLPLEHPIVQKLVGQVMFQLGKVDASRDEVDAFPCKFDLYKGDFLFFARALLIDIAERLCEKPANYARTSLIAEVSSFLSSWDATGELRHLPRRLSEALCEWADGLVSSCLTSEFEILSESRLKQCVYYRHAILCMSSGPSLSMEDAEMIICLTVKCQNLCVDEMSQSEELGRLEAMCIELLCERLDQILDVARQRPGCLTRAIKQIITHCPDNLCWKRFLDADSSPAAGFQARTDACVYSVNVLSGVVLVDGYPPDTLPLEIRQNKLYRKVFGDRNFEVVFKSGGFETTGSVDGRRYSFRLDDKDLHVREIDDTSGLTLELLDLFSVNCWGADLPLRLQKMHSHWILHDRSAVLLRGKSFNDRAVRFVIKLDRDQLGGPAESPCYLVPEELKLDTPRLCQVFETAIFDRLVLLSPSSTVVSVLQKFEDPNFIHAVVSHEGRIRFEMPRFKLSFEHQNGSLVVREAKGFYLARTQLMEGTLHGFSRYLIIERHDEATPKLSLVVPEGSVERQIDGSTVIEESDRDCTAVLQFHRFPYHARYKTFKATSRHSTLRLVALHAATSMNVADELYGLTGSERALELLRQCWTSSPLSNEEMSSLENIITVCSGRHTSLSLVCLEIFRSSEQVSFLYRGTSAMSFRPTLLELGSNCDDVNLYLLQSGSRRYNSRTLLTRGEMGLCFGGDKGLTNEDISDAGVVDLNDAQHHAERIDRLEMVLCSLVEELDGASLQSSATEFPLSSPQHSSRLEQLIYDDLRESWNDYNASLNCQFVLRQKAMTQIEVLIHQVASVRCHLETRLASAFDGCLKRDEVSSLSSCTVGFSKLAGTIPTVTVMDFTRVLYDPYWIVKLNPLLNKVRDDVYSLIISWHRCCVLEDKLLRLRSFDDESDVVSELRVARLWDVAKYPTWLAFEVENCLQIRPEQAVVALHLLDNPGDIVQLNMGLGKTRVILPMLVLHWAHHCRDNDLITRVNILPNLFSEARDFFSDALTASVCHTKVFLLPFCRDVFLDEQRITAMRMLLIQCRLSRGVFLASPEHRLSLELKAIELRRFGLPLFADMILKDICDSEHWREVIDESDELLHHRFRLIYATGSVTELPEAIHRYRMPQYLFGKMRSSPHIVDWINRHPTVVVVDGDGSCETFPPLRINARCFTEEKAIEFRQLLADAILIDPPYELDWVRNHPAMATIRRFVVNPSASFDVSTLSDDHVQDILAMRGHLAGDLLSSCLQKRHRVDFGINREGKKRIAIPFRGADVPAARSEFAHPDCSIALTCLSYYSDGLNESQLTETFSALLLLGQESQRKQYRSWFLLSKPRMSDEDSVRLDCVEKIDLLNMSQFAKLMEFYRRNMETINFWLRNIVFPAEMQHFPERMTATSWNLADNSGGQVVGFSGTNDNHRILPRQVQQYFLDPSGAMDETYKQVWLALMGTNGLMVSRILDHTLNCVCLPSQLSASSGIFSLVKRLLNHVRVGAIIDAGALFAGLSNERVALELTRILGSQSRFRGVTFFDIGKWRIRELSTGRILPKDRSPIAEQESFAFFDEPRCRGADLKLDAESIAILTLGPGMCKDKIMQAAGRMRKLGNKQKLIIAGTKEVMDQVKACIPACDGEAHVFAKAVLEWTLKNTVDCNAQGLLPWASQGFFHATCYNNPDLMVEPEQASLLELYGPSFDTIPTSAAVRSKRQHYIQRAEEATNKVLQTTELTMLNGIAAMVEELGCMVLRSVRGTDEECERELELEREQEQEDEIEIPRIEAVSESKWDISKVVHLDGPKDLPAAAGIKSLQYMVEHHLLPSSLCRIAWSDQVFVTGNFFISVCDRSNQCPAPLNHYLRQVDSCLFFPGKNEVLLISEREADLVIEEILNWRAVGCPSKQCGVVLFHLSLLRTAADGKIAGLRRDLLTLAVNPFAALRINALSDDLLACLQLFAGETVYATDARKASLKKLLQRPGRSASDEPTHLLAARGLSQCYPYSDLEEVCKEVAREEEALKFYLPTSGGIETKEIKKTNKVKGRRRSQPKSIP